MRRETQASMSLSKKSVASSPVEQNSGKKAKGKKMSSVLSCSKENEISDINDVSVSVDEREDNPNDENRRNDDS